MIRRLGLAVIALAVTASVAGGQAPAVLLDRAVRAYVDLDYERASALLRSAVTSSDMADTQRAFAFGYLGASELFRGRPGAAREAFERALAADPRFAPDTLVFPPVVVSLFRVVRSETRGVSVTVQPATDPLHSMNPLNIRLHATSVSGVVVRLVPPEPLKSRVLYEGPVPDSLDISWDGLDGGRSPPVAGRYLLTVVTSARSGKTRQMLSLPLDVQPLPVEALLPPPQASDAKLLPERTTAGPAVRAVGGALLVAGLAAALPAVAGAEPAMGPERFVVTGAAGVAGLAAWILLRPGRPIPENARRNAEARSAWQRQADYVRVINATRGRAARFMVTPGTVTVTPEGRL